MSAEKLQSLRMHTYHPRYMLLNTALMKVFYYVKPMIPRMVQISLRRKLAQLLRERNRDIWPIDSRASTVPRGWRGWPDSKDFAFLLSHDVDTSQGYDNVLKLSALEEQLGFRSTFNFVPERYGEISLDLISP